MGQYYLAYNFDKHEFIRPQNFHTGWKLMEFSYVGNWFSNALKTLIASRWAGDRIALVGDYAFGEDERLDSLTNKNPWEVDGISLNVSDQFPRSSNDSSFRECLNGKRFIVNVEDGIYVDTSDALVSDFGLYVKWDGSRYQLEDYVWQIDPLCLLVALGNGLGGGDYYGPGQEFVGSWAGKPLMAFDSVGDIPEDAEKFMPPFTELRGESEKFLNLSDEEIVAAGNLWCDKHSRDLEDTPEILQDIEYHIPFDELVQCVEELEQNPNPNENFNE